MEPQINSDPLTPEHAQIRKLPQEVINRIAAGEVVVRPSAALKELLENSLDACSTAITVTVIEGGLKLLQVTDNGNGISHEDLPLLCERFATSKITCFDDLETISTFGFRGEALASMSHVARLSVLSKTQSSPVAYKASYMNGALKSDARATAGVDGTSISIEDMFYNMTTRRTALRSSSDEYRCILDVVNKYSIRYPTVGFVCKRQQSGSARGSGSADLRTRADSTTLENIRAVYGRAGTETFSLQVEVSDANASVFVVGSNATFSMKKGVFMLFINGRLVECMPFKRAIWGLYNGYLPKNGQPLVYVEVKMRQEDIDVNVHPTKKEVRFLNEIAIVGAVVEAMGEKLKVAENSRTFRVQSVTGKKRSLNQTVFETGENRSTLSAAGAVRTVTSSGSTKDVMEGEGKKVKQYAKDKVRTEGSAAVGLYDVYLSTQEAKAAAMKMQGKQGRGLSSGAGPLLTSVRRLLEEERTHSDEAMTKTLREAVFVGVACEGYVLLQHGTRLLLAEVEAIVRRLVFQRSLARFADVEGARMCPGAPVQRVVGAHAGAEEGARWTKVLAKKADMLEEYFGLRFEDDGDGKLRLTGVPVILPHMRADERLLGRFLHDVAARTPWDEESGCFRRVAEALAEWYAEGWRCANANGGREREWVLRHVVFAGLRREFYAPKTFGRDGVVKEITTTSRLYKIFERC